MVELPAELLDLFAFLALPKPSPIPAMRLEYQIAQKLHGASAPSSKSKGSCLAAKGGQGGDVGTDIRRSEARPWRSAHGGRGHNMGE